MQFFFSEKACPNNLHAKYIDFCFKLVHIGQKKRCTGTVEFYGTGATMSCQLSSKEMEMDRD
jgi:hypothetical protein